MALLDTPQAKGAMSGGPTLFGVPMKQASLITVSDGYNPQSRSYSLVAMTNDLTIQLTFQNSALILVRVPSRNAIFLRRPRRNRS